MSITISITVPVYSEYNDHPDMDKPYGEITLTSIEDNSDLIGMTINGMCIYISPQDLHEAAGKFISGRW